jgi:DNA-binding CsgD family transcriptional regulator
MDKPTTLSVSDPFWHKIIGNLIDALDKPNFWNVLIRYLHDWVEFDSWVVLRFSKRNKPVVYAENRTEDGGVDQLFVDYVNGFYLLDPFFIACIDDPRASLFRLDDVAPDNFEVEDYYQRYFKLNIVADEVQFNLPVDNGDVVILSLGSKKRYSPSDMSLMLAIEPWILALIRQRDAFDELYEYRSGTKPGVATAEPLAEPPTSRSTSGMNLTNRELEIMQLLLSGFSSKGIAQKLHISPETVKAHRRHIYTKLGVKSHPELFAIYLTRSLNPEP